MRRKIEFAAYLKKNYAASTAEKRMGYCETIEGKMSMDMEDIIASQMNIDDARNVLMNDYKPGSYKEMWYAVDTYMAFAASTRTTGWTIIPPTSPVPFPSYAGPGGIVVYENSVPSYERDPDLCRLLEEKYDEIRAFAAKTLIGIWQVFPPIPVYLSKEKPKEIYPYDKDSLRKKVRGICKECAQKCFNPPECPAFHLIWEATEPMIENVAGRFFGGAEPHIVLYFKNSPDPWETSNPKFIAAITKTLAHEYMHFLHAYYVESVPKVAANPLSDKKLKEALADFFGVYYALEQGNTDVAEGRYGQWKARMNTVWPYWNAIKFLPKPYKIKLLQYSAAEIDQAVQKFREVFQASPNPTAAMKILDR